MRDRGAQNSVNRVAPQYKQLQTKQVFLETEVVSPSMVSPRDPANVSRNLPRSTASNCDNLTSGTRKSGQDAAVSARTDSRKPDQLHSNRSEIPNNPQQVFIVNKYEVKSNEPL